MTFVDSLRKKFVFTAVLSIMLVTLTIYGAIAISMHIRGTNQLTEIATLIANNNGSIPEFNNENNYSKYINKETRFSTRYFVIFLDEKNEIKEIDLNHIAAISEENANEMTKFVNSNKKSDGYYGNYRFHVNNEKHLIVFVDGTMQINTINNFIQEALLIIIICLIITLIVASIFSTKALGPLAETFEKQKDFITNAGHDIKTPLAIIRADTEVLELQIGEDNEWLASIKNQTKRLDTLIKTLLGLARIDKSGKQKLELEEFSINDLVNEEINDIKILAKEGCTFNVDEKAKVNIRADKSCIRQVLTILLDNATKYAPENDTINITIKREGKLKKIDFSNTYIGDTNVNPNKFFDRFYREDQSRNTKRGGHGIGLSMAKSLVETNRGRIYSIIDSDSKIHFIMTFR